LYGRTAQFRQGDRKNGGRIVRDPFVAEIRRIRRDIDKLIETDPKRHKADLKAIQEEFKERLLYLRPRRIIKKVQA
jgi:hypothetical protein